MWRIYRLRMMVKHLIDARVCGRSIPAAQSHLYSLLDLVDCDAYKKEHDGQQMIEPRVAPLIAACYPREGGGESAHPRELLHGIGCFALA